MSILPFISSYLGLPSEKAMAPHSSTLTWRIPGMGEPGGLPSMELHRVGHDCSDLAAEAEETFETRSLCHRGCHMLSSQAWALSLRQLEAMERLSDNVTGADISHGPSVNADGRGGFASSPGRGGGELRKWGPLEDR